MCNHQHSTYLPVLDSLSFAKISYLKIYIAISVIYTLYTNNISII